MKNKYYPAGTDLTFLPISHQEERALFASAKSGDADAKEKIFKMHMLLVLKIALGLARGKLPEEEVASAANYALVKAYQSFQPEYPNRFAAYLKPFVRGEISRLWGSLNIVSKLDFSDGEAVVSVPVSDDVGQEDDAEAQEEKDFLLKLSAQAKSVLEPREREIIDLLFSETPTNQSDVARKLGLSRERIRQLTDGALEKLKKELRRLMNLHNLNQ